MARTPTFKYLSLLIFLVPGACATPRPAKPVVELVEWPKGSWQAVANPADFDRIGKIKDAWQAGLADAKAHGFGKAIAAEGELLDPAVALPRAAPSPGSYKCRLIALGAQGRRDPAFVAFKPFFCYVAAEGPLLTIVKQTGSERPAGRIYPDSDERLVFLGAMALGNEETPPAYGDNAKRDMAGIVERVSPFRWRLAMPWPHDRSKLDVLELVPAPS